MGLYLSNPEVCIHCYVLPGMLAEMVALLTRFREVALRISYRRPIIFIFFCGTSIEILECYRKLGRYTASVDILSH